MSETPRETRRYSRFFVDTPTTGQPQYAVVNTVATVGTPYLGTHPPLAPLGSNGFACCGGVTDHNAWCRQ